MLYNSKVSSHTLLILCFCRQLVCKIRQISVYLLFIIHLIIKAKNTRNMLHSINNSTRRLKGIHRMKGKLKIVADKHD